MRPTTQGCSEQTCVYHGGENRFKAAHDEGCPIRSYDGFVIAALDPGYDGPRCECSQKEARA